MQKVMLVFIFNLWFAPIAHAENSALQLSVHAKELLTKKKINASFQETLHALLLNSSDVLIVEQLQTFPYQHMSINDQLLWHQINDLIDRKQQLKKQSKELTNKLTLICDYAICPSQSAYSNNFNSTNKHDDTKETSLPNAVIANFKQEIEKLEYEIAQASLGLKFVSYPDNSIDLSFDLKIKTDSQVSELAQQVVDLSLKLSESGSELIQRMLEIQQLSSELQEARSRLELNQQLLEEKNSRIAELSK